MNYFNKYTSNTSAGSGSQYWFEGTDGIMRGKSFYRVNAYGCFNYSFLYSNTIQGTFADGDKSYRNLELDTWNIISLNAGVSVTADPDADPMAEFPLLFDGKRSKTVSRGELFATDPISLDVPEGAYIYLEISFSGKQIPCHKESVLPIFRMGDIWEKNMDVPVPCMIGCDRKADMRLAFIGDSITQGCGTPRDSYTHFAARVQRGIPDNIAVWDLGLGYGRAQDIASDGIWAKLARNNDAAVICYGVNDILRGRSAEQIIADLEKILEILSGAGIKVLFQTVPPFTYKPEQVEIWHTVNNYILTTLSRKVPVFSNISILNAGPEFPEDKPGYGAHPNAEGHGKWAEALIPAIKSALL